MADPLTPGLLGPRLDVLWPDVSHRLPDATLAVVAAAADEGDATGRMAPAAIDALRTQGYFGLPVPTEMEGGGASLLECCAVQRRLASVDPAVAIALNMHLFSLGVMVEHWRVEKDTSWLLLEAIATQHRVVASGFAEPGLAGSSLRSGCTARPVPGGVVIDGLKAPCSLAAIADLVCFQVQEVSEEGSLLVCLVPTDAPGVRVERTWSWLGMRASESDTLVFEGCEVPDDLVFHRTTPGFDPDDVFAAGMVWFSLTTAAAYLGLVEAALVEASRSLHRQRVEHLGSSRADVAVFQVPFGQVIGDVLEASGAVVATASALDARAVAPHDLLAHALAVKRRVAEVAVRAIDRLAEVMGAGALRVGQPIERLVRDVQAARYHPPTPMVTEQILGRWGLGHDLRVELHGNDTGPPGEDPGR